MLELFLDRPVNIETSVGELSGILTDVDISAYGKICSLLLYTFKGDWILVKNWVSIKSARQST